MNKVRYANVKKAPLRLLNIESSKDPIVAILDAWSMVADVLAFYQERIANEGFLRTATERRSILELARSLGYELKPGLAASTYLVFNVDDAPGSPRIVEVPANTKVQSIPMPGDLPRTFETRNTITARVEWNLLRPKITEVQNLAYGTRRLLLKGLGNGLNPGDVILLIGEERAREPESDAWEIRILEKVSPHPEWDATLISWNEPLKGVSRSKVFALRDFACLFGHNAPDLRLMPQELKRDCNSADEDWPNLKMPFKDEKWVVDLDSVYPRLLQGSWIILSDPHIGARAYKIEKISTVFRTDFAIRSRITRINTDVQKELSNFSIRDTTVYIRSEPLVLAETQRKELLKGDKIEFDSFISGLEIGKILTVSGKRMRGKVHSPELKMILPDGVERPLSQGDFVKVLSRELSDDTKEISWKLLDVDGFVGEVFSDCQCLELMKALDEDEVIGEAISIKSISNKEGRTVVVLEKPLRNTYDLATVTIQANVVSSTDGETVQEVLGSGESTHANQQFSLKKMPLTFVPDSSHGISSTLEVKVNDVVWMEAESLHNLDEKSESYIVQIGDDEKTTIVFGDGKNGARLPTGIENVAAKYRYGAGPEGLVPADRLTLLQMRPRGIRSVTNPLPASCAASPESISDARRNVPRTILTLDRIISLKDYEDFVSGFLGISKAQVKAFQTKKGRLIHITIASSDGLVIDPQSEFIKSLLGAIDKASNSLNKVEISSFHLKTFSIKAGVLVDERYTIQKVLDHVKMILKDEFSFESCDLGQSVSSSEVISCMHRVEGVIAVNLDKLELDPEGITVDIQRAISAENIQLKSSLEQSLPPKNQFLYRGKMITKSSNPSYIIRSAPARLRIRSGKEEIIPAELLLINSGPNGIVLRDLRA